MNILYYWWKKKFVGYHLHIDICNLDLMWRRILSLQLKNFTGQENCLFLFITCSKFTICFVHQVLTVNSCWSFVCTISTSVSALSGFPLWYVMLPFIIWCQKISLWDIIFCCVFLLSDDHCSPWWNQIMPICMSLNQLHPTGFYCQTFLIMFPLLYIFKTSSSNLELFSSASLLHFKN